MSGQLLVLAFGAGVGLWVLHALGRALAKVLEAAAAVAVVFAAVWLAVKGVWTVGRWLVRQWRTTGTVTFVAAWWHWFGLTSLAVTAAVLAVGSALWWWRGRVSFERWAGRRGRSWALRWLVDAPRMPRWLRACQLTVPDPGQPVTVQVTPFRASGRTGWIGCSPSTWNGSIGRSSRPVVPRAPLIRRTGWCGPR
jgi:S-DNA-T family DNA segregation ATPase FtsK/SpoIIIE